MNRLPIFNFAAAGLLAFVLLSCTTPQRKTVAVIEATVDRAMSTWSDYVQWQRGLPVPDPKLASQEDAVRKGFTTYRLAMNAAYDAEAAYTKDKAAGLPAWRQAMDAAMSASNNLLAIVNQFLPPEKRITTKP